MRARTALSTAALAVLTLTTAALATVPAAAAPVTAPAATTAADVTAPAGFVGMAPTRILDTRDYSKVPETRTARPVQAGEYYSTPIAVGCHSHPPQECYGVIPSDATAVVVNVTVTNPTAEGFVSLGSAPGAPGTKPATSSVNFAPGQTVSNLVTVATGPVSRWVPWLTVYNNAGTTDVVLDVVGYYRTAATDKYAPLRPTRIADSRTDGTDRLNTNSVRSYQVARPELGTENASAVVLNVTAVDGYWDSYLTVYPSGRPRPDGSNLNFPVSTTASNRVVVPVGADGRIDVYNHVGGVHVIVDVVGYFGPSGTGLFSALKTPVRSFDSRVGGGPVPGSGTVRVQAVPTDGSVPNAVGVEANVTATDVVADGHLIVFPGPGLPTDTSTVNVTTGRTTSNSATTAVAADGTYSIHNHGADLDVIADVTGYYVTG
ncbi:hypothetical protein AB0E96_16355 [Kitasatospora sp. NPDC036755]|uniref:hypothetical protein n=1 Tax=Kitasatospora sp. NPDC036755 TaxID=3154600 RepID=UPI0033D293C0